MSDYDFKEGRTATLTYWALGHMAKGMGLALAFCVAIGVIFAVIWGVSLLLPDASKTMPSPYGQIQSALPLFV
jgi:hypothetical protein